MLFYQNGVRTSTADLRQTSSGTLVVFLNQQQMADAPKALRTTQFAEANLSTGSSTRFESHKGFDYIVIQVPNFDAPDADPSLVQIYYSGRQLLFVGDHTPALDMLAAELDKHQQDPLPLDRVLYLFFNCLTGTDSQLLEKLEDEISALDDEIVGKGSAGPDDNRRAISLLRKKLMARKRYYEALLALLEDLEENWNGLLSAEQLRNFRIQTNRAERLYHAVLNLRDYVTQVREAYQNQLDIGLNETMKLFTVITAVFLPLSLIAGWYGMNLLMPEYQSPYAYPIVIVVSVAVALGCLLYFKKHKWF